MKQAHIIADKLPTLQKFSGIGCKEITESDQQNKEKSRNFIHFRNSFQRLDLYILDDIRDKRLQSIFTADNRHSKHIWH